MLSTKSITRHTTVVCMSRSRLSLERWPSKASLVSHTSSDSASPSVVGRSAKALSRVSTANREATSPPP